MTDDDEPEIDNDDSGAEDTPAQDAASKRSYDKKLTEIELRQKEARDFWKAVFAIPVGRREMFEILKSSNAFDPPFMCGPNGFPQPEATWFHAGQHALGQRLFLSWSLLDRDGVNLMLDENDPRFAKPSPPKRQRRK